MTRSEISKSGIGCRFVVLELAILAGYWLFYLRHIKLSRSYCQYWYKAIFQAMLHNTFDILFQGTMETWFLLTTLLSAIQSVEKYDFICIMLKGALLKYMPKSWLNCGKISLCHQVINPTYQLQTKTFRQKELLK